MLSVTDFARQCFCLHLWGQLTWDLSRTSEDRNFINKALRQKAKEKTNKTGFRIWSCGIMYNSQMCFILATAQVWLGLWELINQTFEIYGQFISFSSMLIFLSGHFHTVFTCYVGNSNNNQSSNSTSGHISKKLKARNSRNFCIPLL